MAGEPAAIVLVRHGRPAPVTLSPAAPGRLLDASQFAAWCAGYARATLVPTDAPPPALRALVRDGARLVASDLPRAVATAALLTPGAAVETSSLLRETEPLVPPWPRVRLPLAGWLVAWRAGWLAGARWPGGETRGAAERRAAAAADWLAGLARRGADDRDADDRLAVVVAVTHGAIRPLIVTELRRSGWRGRAWGRYAHWSAWTILAPAARP